MAEQPVWMDGLVAIAEIAMRMAYITYTVDELKNALIGTLAEIWT